MHAYNGWAYVVIQWPCELDYTLRSRVSHERADIRPFVALWPAGRKHVAWHPAARCASGTHIIRWVICTWRERDREHGRENGIRRVKKGDEATRWRGKDRRWNEWGRGGEGKRDGVCGDDRGRAIILGGGPMPLRDLCAALSRDISPSRGPVSAPFLPPKGARGYIARQGYYSGYRAGRTRTVRSALLNLLSLPHPLHPFRSPATVPPLGFVSRLFVASYLSAVRGWPNRVTCSRMQALDFFHIVWFLSAASVCTLYVFGEIGTQRDNLIWDFPNPLNAYIHVCRHLLSFLRNITLKMLKISKPRIFSA